MKILVLCDDYWHPGEVIERGLDFLKDEHELDFVCDAKDILTPEFIRRYDLLICAKMNEINASNRTPWFDRSVAELQVSDLRDYVREGHGYLALHAGSAFYWDRESDREYCEFLGCAFVQHPPRCTIREKMKGTHPITDGVAPFTIRDEHYMIDHLAPDMQVIMESTSEAGGTQVGAFVRTMGDGRICTLVPGHIASVFENPEYRKMIRRAILWCHGDI